MFIQYLRLLSIRYMFLEPYLYVTGCSLGRHVYKQNSVFCVV